MELWIYKDKIYISLLVRKTAKIRKWYNQVPHLTQDTTWESNKNTINISNVRLSIPSIECRFKQVILSNIHMGD